MHERKVLIRLCALAVVVGMVLVLMGCAAGGSSSSSTAANSGTSSGIKIALLLPESKTARYETQDKPLFEAKVKAIDPTAQILYSNANQDPAQQQSQADAALTNGANVLVLDAVDSTSAASIVSKAAAKGVPVIAYDRLVNGAPIDNYVSFDNHQVGVLQGTALLEKLKATVPAGKKPTIVMINGSPTDANAAQFKAGAHSVLDGQVNIAAEYDTPDWSPDQAQTEMDQAITKLGKTGFDGVYAANDGTAGGAIAAMKAAGIDPTTKPTTGQDAELAAIQRIVLGEQYMTVYKAISKEASAAAVLAVALANKQQPPATLQMTTVNNGNKDVPSVLLVPVAVTKGNIKDTVVADKFWTIPQIVNSPQLQAAAAKLGLQ